MGNNQSIVLRSEKILSKARLGGLRCRYVDRRSGVRSDLRRNQDQRPLVEFVLLKELQDLKKHKIIR